MARVFFNRLFFVLGFAFLGWCVAFADTSVSWKLVKTDEFSGSKLNSKLWARIRPGKHDWNRNMSLREDLVRVKDGVLSLYGIRNDGKDPKETRKVLTGGVTTRGLFALQYGKIEFRMKLEDHQKGAWPAVWMMPEKEVRGWPNDGEIDIVERLNGDDFVYQTAHYSDGTGKDLTKGGRGKIKNGEWNLYALEWTPETIVWKVNDIETHRVTNAGGKLLDYPWRTPFYLMIDMQLGGNWVGAVDEKSLPVAMHIDWVKFYEAEIAPRPRPNKALAARIKDESTEVFGIVHWGLNTYTDREWGFGDEDPKMLNPAAFDADQIVGACKAGGLGGLVVVAKHHDGFCLWPTKSTEHNIMKAPFRGGKGDYIREMEKACRKEGLKFGVYVSPWDRNSAKYGTDAYVTEVFQRQIRELLSGTYGEIFEMWFDGANGGDGWYGGAKGRRTIPNGYYRYDGETFEIVRELQPKVCIFGDGGEFRWPKNERGLLCEESRATTYPGVREFLNSGHPFGTKFQVAEADFPLRRGWFYHARDDGHSRCGEFLMKLYLSSVGNGGVMDIGIAPNKEGRLSNEDVKKLARFGEIKKSFFENPVKPGSGKPFNVIVMKEKLSKGEQVDAWEFVADGKVLCEGRSIGLKRIRVLPEPIVASKCEIRVLADGGNLMGTAFRCYFVDPKLLNRVMNATTENGETDTAQWMQGLKKHE